MQVVPNIALVSSMVAHWCLEREGLVASLVDLEMDLYCVGNDHGSMFG